MEKLAIVFIALVVAVSFYFSDGGGGSKDPNPGTEEVIIRKDYIEYKGQHYPHTDAGRNSLKNDVGEKKVGIVEKNNSITDSPLRMDVERVKDILGKSPQY